MIASRQPIAKIVPTPQEEQITTTEKIITTEEENEGFQIVRAILRKAVDIDRIIARDTQSYFGVLLDDNNRKPLCRLHFNAKQKYVGTFDEGKNETRHPISRLEDIFNFSEAFLATALTYDKENAEQALSKNQTPKHE